MDQLNTPLKSTSLLFPSKNVWKGLSSVKNAQICFELLDVFGKSLTPFIRWRWKITKSAVAISESSYEISQFRTEQCTKGSNLCLVKCFRCLFSIVLPYFHMSILYWVLSLIFGIGSSRKRILPSVDKLFFCNTEDAWVLFTKQDIKLPHLPLIFSILHSIDFRWLHSHYSNNSRWVQ